MYRYIAVFGLMAITLSSVNVAGQSLPGGWKEEVNIYARTYDAPLRTTDRGDVTLLQLAEDKPLILALIFMRCSGVCTPFLLRLKDNIQLVSARKEFNIAVLSFDPRDDLHDMHSLSQKFDLGNDPRWIFAVTDSIDTLNQSIGFYPVWDERRKQYDHDALLLGINRRGFITKKLIGIRNAKDLEALISSAQDIFSPTYRLSKPNTLFSCFNYDPETGKNRPGTGLLFIALPSVVTLTLLVAISCLVRQR